MSVPRRVIRRREYTRMADGKDVDFVFDGFVHDAVGFDDEMEVPHFFWHENGRTPVNKG